MRTRVEIDTPPAGTACAPCQRKRHFCPARVYRDDEPACPACAAGAECETSQALRRLREPWDQLPDNPMPPPVRRIEPATVLTVPDRAHAATPIEKENPMLANLNRPLCKAEGCAHAASRKGSFCTSKHYYLLKKELAGEVGKLTAATCERESDTPSEHKEDRWLHEIGRCEDDCAACHQEPIAEPQPDEPSAVAIDLTLRLLYHRCTPGQKAMALSSLLHQLLAI